MKKTKGRGTKSPHPF